MPLLFRKPGVRATEGGSLPGYSRQPSATHDTRTEKTTNSAHLEFSAQEDSPERDFDLGTLHGDETSTHAPFGDGLLDFDVLVPELLKANVAHDWWTIDLCFWPDAWEATEQCKKAVDELAATYT